MLVEEWSHRVLNDYTRAVAALHLAAVRTADPELQQLITGLARGFLNRAEAFRMLRAPSEQTLVDVGDYLHGVCEAITVASLAEADINLTLLHRSMVLPADRCWCLGLVVAELVNNAARHGLGWTTGQIEVELFSSGLEVCCRVANRARVADLSVVGRGQRIISALLDEFGGRARWQLTDTGVSVVVHMPLESRTTVPL